MNKVILIKHFSTFSALHQYFMLRGLLGNVARDLAIFVYTRHPLQVQLSIKLS